MSATFTMEMAKVRGLTSNPIYAKFPDNMLKFKAVGMVAKFIVPDALHGIAIKEDLEGSITETPSEKITNGEPKITVQLVEPKHKSLEEVLTEEKPVEETIENEKEVKPKKSKKVEDADGEQPLL